MTHAHATRRRLRLAGPAVAVLLSVGLVGCGSDGSDTAVDSPAAEPASPTVATPADPSSGSPADPAAGSTSSADAALPAWAPKIVTDADDSVTGLDFTGTPAPTGELQFAIVRTGDGPVVKTGQTITANYFGQLPDETAPFDESYSSQPFTAAIGVGQLIPGWDQTLPGVPVGSRVIMSVPPDLGYGDQGQGPIPGGATLFFVIDILDAQ